MAERFRVVQTQDLAVGDPQASTFDGRERYANERDTAKYVEMIETQKTAEIMCEDIDLTSECIFLGLRLESGIDLAGYVDRFGYDLIEKFRSQIEQLEEAGLVEIDNDYFRLTQKGKLFSNEVFAVFV